MRATSDKCQASDPIKLKKTRTPCLLKFFKVLSFGEDLGEALPYLLLLVGFAITSPTIIKFFVGVFAFDVTTIVFVNGAAKAAL